MSDSFIQEMRLKRSPHSRKVLNTRFTMAEFLYNAVLQEGLNRLKLMRESKEWQPAKKTVHQKKRQKAFRELKELYEYSDYAFQHYATETKNSCAIKDHLDAHVCQKIATRVFLAVDAYKKGIRGKPRFKRRGWLSSIEGKSNDSGIRFRDNKVFWQDLELTPILDKKDHYGIQAHALKSKIKYCRLIRKKIKGEDVFFLQLVLEGKPLLKEKNLSCLAKVVGLDVGPSTLAVSGEKKAFLKAFCENLQPLHLRTRLLQRQMDRSLRAMNPDNYDDKKRAKNRIFHWEKSHHYKQKQAVLSETHRVLKEARKRAHGQYANELLKMGNIIRTEKLSYSGFQKNFGRSVGFRAPGLFMNILRRKAENAGGHVEEFSTNTTALSQICNNCGTKRKKSLSERWHACSCGITMQRDLYSAFLARFVSNNQLDTTQATIAWEGAHSLLKQAVSSLNQTASGKLHLASFGMSQSRSGSLVKDRSNIDEAENVVGVTPESLGESDVFAVRRTPWL